MSGWRVAGADVILRSEATKDLLSVLRGLPGLPITMEARSFAALRMTTFF
jgi:hypothetical protein